MPTLAVYTDIPDLKARAEKIAQRLNLPFVLEWEHFDYLLVLESNHLSIKKSGYKALPLSIYFLSGKMTYRRQHASLRRETLARAMGLKNKATTTIVDATAGLGRDSFILACLGFEITLLERSAIVHALLADGIERASQDEQTAIIAKRLNLIHTDAILWLQQLQPQDRPNIIYLDPMFPERNKSALVKKEMRMFHEIIGEDLDADALLTSAMACATQRVVVKRPRLAPHLAGLKPSYSMEGSSSRFDIYLNINLMPSR